MSEKKVIVPPTPIIVAETKENPLSFDEQKEIKRKKNQLNTQVKKSEETISTLENKIKTLDAQILSLDYTNKAESAKVLAEYDSTKRQLNKEMEIWENSTEELMTIKE